MTNWISLAADAIHHGQGAETFISGHSGNHSESVMGFLAGIVGDHSHSVSETMQHVQEAAAPILSVLGIGQGVGGRGQ